MNPESVLYIPNVERVYVLENAKTYEGLQSSHAHVKLIFVMQQFHSRCPTFVYSFANSISPQKMFIAPRKPRAPMNKGLEDKNCAEVRMPYTESRESSAPITIIRLDKRLPIFADALKTSRVSTSVVSFRSSSSRCLKPGAATTISFLFFFFGISTTTIV